MAHIARIEIVIPEKYYYAYYMRWISFHIMPTELLEGALPFKTELHIRCKYDDGRVDQGRYLSPIYKTVTSINENHPQITAGYSIICFK